MPLLSPNSVSRMAQEGSTALELALENNKEEAAAVLRAHGAQVSLFFAAEKGMTDEVAARIAAGKDVNARDQVIFLCWWVGARASAHIYIYIYYIYIYILYIYIYIYIYKYIIYMYIYIYTFPFIYIYTLR